MCIVLYLCEFTQCGCRFMGFLWKKEGRKGGLATGIHFSVLLKPKKKRSEHGVRHTVPGIRSLPEGTGGQSEGVAGQWENKPGCGWPKVRFVRFLVILKNRDRVGITSFTTAAIENVHYLVLNYQRVGSQKIQLGSCGPEWQEWNTHIAEAGGNGQKFNGSKIKGMIYPKMKIIP